MRTRIIAAAALWLLAGTGIVTLAMFHDALALVPGLLWLVVTLYGLASLGYKLAWLPADRLLEVLGKVLRVGLLTPLVTRFDRSRFENENRQNILAYLEEHPGASIQEVRVAQDIAWGTAVYHLDRLRRQALVVGHRQGNHHRYWIANTPEARVRRGWSILEQSTARDIAMAVAATPGVHQGAICEAVNVRAPSASKHLARLEEHGLVEKFRISRYTVYQPTEELERILAMQGAGMDAGPTPEQPGAGGLDAPASFDAPARMRGEDPFGRATPDAGREVREADTAEAMEVATDARAPGGHV